jgi:carbamoyltransferase
MHKKDHITVGISRVHNSAVTLLKNGELVFHIENERLSNIKYDAYVFQTLAKLPEYVDHVDDICIAGVGATVPVENFTTDNVYTTFIARLNKDFYNKDYNVYDLWKHHHKLHAACAFYNSGFKQAVCIIKDGMGSDYPITDLRFQPRSYGRETSSTFLASYPAVFELIDKTISVPFKSDVVIDGNVTVTEAISEALAFQKTSKYFGFHELDAGKVMGMSSYGKPTTTNPLIFKNNKINTELFKPTTNDLRTVELNTDVVPHLVNADFQTQANFAYDLQQQTQQEIKSYILKIVEQTGCKNVCLSGGYFLNCVANYEFLNNLPKDINLYVEPISSDAGTSIGAAKLIWHEKTGDTTVRPQKSIYYGLKYNYTLDNILKQLVTETSRSVTPSEVAEIIANKNIVAIYQGSSESGPRALGNRSILYDPRDPNGKDHVNTVKNREWFRPFAGTILHEKTNEWFDLRGLEESPYMMFAVNVLKDKQELIPAITHVDGTCRVQTLKQDTNPHFYKLIEEFYKLTNVPILFNTSFNLAGDCIVETIEDALNTIRKSTIEYLYLPEFNLLIQKEST